MSDLKRFTITMPTDLLEYLDTYAQRRGMNTNRSEAIRDLVRKNIVEEVAQEPDAEIVGSLTLVYNHHASDLKDRIDSIQHDHCDEIISSMHVHLDAHNCLETIVMRGKSSTVHEIADAILGTKGVMHGNLTVTLVDGASHAHKHAHSHE